MDSKELSLLKHLPRVFRSSSFISSLRNWAVLWLKYLPLITLNSHSANLLHWLHHFCQGFYSSSRPIWIKFEIISLPDLSSWLNSKIIASDLFTICELNSWFHRSILYLQDYGYSDDKFLTSHFDEWSSCFLRWDIRQLLALVGFLTASFES